MRKELEKYKLELQQEITDTQVMIDHLNDEGNHFDANKYMLLKTNKERHLDKIKEILTFE